MTRLRPIQLTQIALAASFLTALPALIGFLPAPWIHAGGAKVLKEHLPALYAIAICFLAGLCIDAWAELKLRRGRERAIWTDAELEESTKWISRPVMSGLNICMVFAYIGVFAWTMMTSHRAGGLGLAIFPSLTLSRLMSTQKPAPPPGVQGIREKPAPLHSQHWGQQA